MAKIALLAENARKITEALRNVLAAYGVIDEMEDHIAIHLPNPESFLKAADAAFQTANTARTVLRNLGDSLDAVAELGSIVAVIQAAQEMVQADNACVLGRDGCERRWDEAMKALKSSLARVRE